MPRLRTTAGLSLLALAVAIGGTAWLSTLSDDWAGPPARTVAHTAKARTMVRRYPRAMHEPREAAHTVARAAPVPAAWPTLTPIDMPSPAVPFLRRSAPLNGRVMLHLHVNGEGRVAEAAVAQTSGDANLDDRAMQMARGWRFAVPPDRPDGLEGSLVMRFDEGADQPLSAP